MPMHSAGAEVYTITLSDTKPAHITVASELLLERLIVSSLAVDNSAGAAVVTIDDLEGTELIELAFGPAVSAIEFPHSLELGISTAKGFSAVKTEPGTWSLSISLVYRRMKETV